MKRNLPIKERKRFFVIPRFNQLCYGNTVCDSCLSESIAENNFGERKFSCTRLNFGEILFAGTKLAVPGVQYGHILPARVANQNTEFVAYCLLAELAI